MYYLVFMFYNFLCINSVNLSSLFSRKLKVITKQRVRLNTNIGIVTTNSLRL